MKKLNEKLLKTTIVNRIKDDVEKCNVSGVAVMVAQDGKVLLDERLGYFNPITKQPLKRNTLFRLASMTKPVTAIATLICVERGYFSLDDNITKYFPEFENMMVGKIVDGKVVPDHKPLSDITVWQFLNHTSGFMCNSPVQESQMNNMPISAFKDAKTAVDYCLKNTCLTFEPGENAGYCGYFGFDVITLLIEKFSGMKYFDFVKKNIFEPLNIKDITYNPTQEQWERMIAMTDKMEGRGYSIVDMGEHTFENFPKEYHCGGAGLAGTIEDYFIFASMLQNGGEYNGVRILKEETLKLMYTKLVPTNVNGIGLNNTWGVGVRVVFNDLYLEKGTFGWSGAYGTHFWIDRVNKITAIYMKNSRWHDSHGCGITGRNFEIDVCNCFEENN